MALRKKDIKKNKQIQILNLKYSSPYFIFFKQEIKYVNNYSIFPHFGNQNWIIKIV